MRKSQARAMAQNDLPITRDPLPLDVAVVNNSISPDSQKLDNSQDKCYVCDGTICKSVYRVGDCGCKFGNECFDSTYIEECPTCPSKDPNPAIDSFSGNVAAGMVEVGELASLALEDLAKSASNFINSNSSFGNSPPYPQMSQRQHDNVMRNVQIAKTVAGTAASATGYVANGVGSCLCALGNVLSPVVRGVSKQILSECKVDNEKAERMVNGGMEIAKAAIITTGSVARGFQCSTGILASGVCSRLARQYESSHGFQPGELESNVGEIAENVFDAAWNVIDIHPKSKLTKVARIDPSTESKDSNVEM